MPLTILLQAFYFALSFAAPALMGGFFTGAPAWAQLLCLFLCGGGCFAASAYLGRKRLRLGLPLLAAGLAACLLLNGLAWATLLPAGALFFLCVLALRHRYAPQARPIESRITVIGLLLFGEALSAGKILALLLVICGIIMINTAKDSPALLSASAPPH